MTDITNATPTAIRRLESKDAARLARLVEAYDELQTVLRCCERLIAIMGDGASGPDDIGVEALWTLALLSYARAFAEKDGVVALIEADIQEPGKDGEVLRWHKVLLHLRERYADAASNPRETYTVGVAQDEAGAANAVAVTSVLAPMIDIAAVRQAGAIAFPLCAVLDERIDPLQQSVLATVRKTPKAELDSMELIEVAATP